MTQPRQQDANALLMSGGIKSIKWKDNPVGYTVIGTIVDEPKAAQMTKYESDELDFWPSGDPKMQIIVTIQTDLRDPSDTLDDGKRHLHIPPRMMPPVREAVKKVGAAGLAIGGRLAVRRIGGTGATGSPFEFAAEYAQPAVDPGGLLAGNNGNGETAGQRATGVIGNVDHAAAITEPPASMLGAPSTVQTSMLAAPQLPPPPPGVDPQKWANLPEAQRQAVLAAMAPMGTSPAHKEAPF